MLRPPLFQAPYCRGYFAQRDFAPSAIAEELAVFLVAGDGGLPSASLICFEFHVARLVQAECSRADEMRFG
jgi:hypothetical protein